MLFMKYPFTHAFGSQCPILKTSSHFGHIYPCELVGRGEGCHYNTYICVWENRKQE
ncbi:uncharacterized protein C8R40DRAFT_1128597 [Lentinula edodes]|uniref:uncharacterized protein n=1 Tax=Lentinula edodes TaxID=5353 RepID=UPI001E8CE2B6|nr:uncharacterized protein C8R40DRAFT_1128597 [Lentinula edodes]KAH7869865.1 hypothetical protein C8R40DRAFT_1128597 [Lentinula edodes]